MTCEGREGRIEERGGSRGLDSGLARRRRRRRRESKKN